MDWVHISSESSGSDHRKSPGPGCFATLLQGLPKYIDIKMPPKTKRVRGHFREKTMVVPEGKGVTIEMEESEDDSDKHMGAAGKTSVAHPPFERGMLGTISSTMTSCDNNNICSAVVRVNCKIQSTGFPPLFMQYKSRSHSPSRCRPRLQDTQAHQ
uniref:Uncharacterized protein n=1 Tax=Branchiostoma floridae TaxID=7739 RepID=C3YHV1_BRAFL|eukprot:XP_002604077.1 hypothetical protein BRAFLDRAFT_71633 [Branchiostoma floridae]